MVKNFFKNGIKIFSVRQTNILTAATVIMFLSLASRLLGLLRDRLLAHYFTSDLVGIYFAAFRIPDLLFQILVFGALSVAFIPVFTEYLKKDRESAWDLASSLLNLTFLIFLVLLVLLFIFAEPLSLLLVPGLPKENPAHLALLVNLTRIILLAQIFFVVSAFLTGILHSFQRFLVPAAAAFFYNLGIILGIYFGQAWFGIYGAALGAVLGAFLHFLIQLPLTRSLGFHWRFDFHFSHPGVREIGKLTLPRSIALAADQINLAVDTILASLISLSSITFLTFAQHLALVPVGLFGATIAQAALPILSHLSSEEGLDHFRQTLISCFRQIAFLVIPLSVAMIILHTPIIRLVFGAKLFTWDATVLTARTLAFLAVGVCAQSSTLLLNRAFYALRDTMTPLKIGLVSIVLNILASVTFINFFHFPVWGLGLSASIAASTNLILLLFFLRKKIGGFTGQEFIMPLSKMFFAAFAMAGVLYLPVRLLDRVVLDTTRTINLIFLIAISGTFGFLIYLALAQVLHLEEVKTFWSLFKRLGNWRQVLSQSQEVLEEAKVS